jgi:hypothetical protein
VRSASGVSPLSLGAVPPPPTPAMSAHTAILMNLPGVVRISPPGPRTRYTRYQLMAIRSEVQDRAPDANVLRAIEASGAAEAVSADAADAVRRQEELLERFPYHCATCAGTEAAITAAPPGARGGAPPGTHFTVLPPAATPAGITSGGRADGACAQIQELVKNVVQAQRKTNAVFLLQNPVSVFGMMRLAALFDGTWLAQAEQRAAKRSGSRPQVATRQAAAIARLRQLSASDKVVSRVRAFLCGDGFHLSCPKPTDDALWTALTHLLRFDLILEQRTPFYAELSHAWRRRHTPFEQFSHILFWRDEVPYYATTSLVTHAEMPLAVATAAGDVDAVVLLGHLGFPALPDSVQWGFPFMNEIEPPVRRAVLRHLGIYLYRVQSERLARGVRIQ